MPAPDTRIHRDLTGANAIHPAAYVQASDPGNVGARKFWTDTSTDPATLRCRNDANTAWFAVGEEGSAAVTPRLAAVRVAATGNVSIITPPTTLNGLTLVTGDRLLLPAQTDPAENGTYTFFNGVTPLQRTDDLLTSGQFVPGLTVYVRDGALNPRATWTLSVDDDLLVGTDPIVFDRLGFGASVNLRFDVRDYGAVGVSGTDDRAAFQAAADDAAAYGFGESLGILYIPANGGNDYYYVGYPGLTVTCPIEFAGGAVVHAIANASDYDLFTWAPEEGLSIRGDGRIDAESHGGNALVLNGVNEAWIDGPQIWNNFGFGGTHGAAIKLTNCFGVVIGPHTSIQGGNPGIQVTDSVNCLLGGILRQNTTGILLDGSSNHNVVLPSVIRQSSAWGVQEDPAGTCHDNIVNPCAFESNTSGDVSLVGTGSRAVGVPANAKVTYYYPALGATPVTNQNNVASPLLNGFTLSGDFYVNDLPGDYVVTTRVVAEIGVALTTGAVAFASDPGKSLYVPPGVTGNFLLGSWHVQAFDSGAGVSLLPHKLGSASLTQGTGGETINLLIEIFCERLT